MEFRFQPLQLVHGKFLITVLQVSNIEIFTLSIRRSKKSIRKALRKQSAKKDPNSWECLLVLFKNAVSEMRKLGKRVRDLYEAILLYCSISEYEELRDEYERLVETIRQSIDKILSPPGYNEASNPEVLVLAIEKLALEPVSSLNIGNGTSVDERT